MAIHAPAHLFRTVLVDAVVRREVGQSVGTQHGEEKEREIVQKVTMLSSVQHIADKEEHGILAIGLTGMYARFHQNDVLPAPTDLLRVGITLFIYYQQGDVTSLGGLPNGLVMHFVKLLGQLFGETDRAFVTVCL